MATLDDVPDAACRRIIAATLLQALKDRVGTDAQAAYDAEVFIRSARAAELAGLIDLPWPPSDEQLARFANDPTLYLPAFIMASGEQ